MGNDEGDPGGQDTSNDQNEPGGQGQSGGQAPSGGQSGGQPPSGGQGQPGGQPPSGGQGQSGGHGPQGGQGQPGGHGPQGNQPAIRETVHGFFSRHEPDGLYEMHEGTLFITDQELVAGDQGRYKPMGGLLKVLPEGLAGIVRRFKASGDATTISYGEAENRRGTRRVPLTDIREIEVEKGMPPLGKSLIEVEYGHHKELAIYVGTDKSHGEAEETKAFVEALDAAARDAGGSPIVHEEYDF